MNTNRYSISTSTGMVYLNQDDIIFCSAEGRYTTFHLKSGEKLVLPKMICDVESILDKEFFFRVHRSSLVNIDHILKFRTGQDQFILLSNNVEIKVSRRKSAEFRKHMNEKLIKF
jgi:two-component system LytT family response regulator